MNVKLNDQTYEVSAGTALSTWLSGLGYFADGIAVAVNGEIVPKSTWDSFFLTDNADILVIHAVAGG
ncbi:MAG: sulfur carrier protein ThiS [Bacteroidales bacterium]|nr:sulfur carrier protein ThiS [Bacteroidales bacterium]